MERMSQPPASGAEPRSLAEDLRGRDDAALLALFEHRPDLLVPVPTDLGQLAARASSHASVARALDRLTALDLQVLEAVLVAADPAPRGDLLALLGDDPAVDAALDRLYAQALLWGSPRLLRLPRPVRDLLHPSPAGLGPAPPLGWPADRLAGVLAEAPADARAVLDRLAWGPSTGRVRHATRPVTPATAVTPVDWLLARGLLVPVDARTVALPRDVALHLRGGRLHPELVSAPPVLAPTPAGTDPTVADRRAAAAGAELVRLVEDLLEGWGRAGPPVLRAGGLGLRELRRAAAGLGVDEPTAGLVVEVAYAGGLVGRGGDAGGAWLPSRGYDGWRRAETAQRWAALAAGWLASDRVASLVGSRDPADRPRAALGVDLEVPGAGDLRAAVLGELAGLPPGTTTDPAALVARLRWQRPRRSAATTRLLVTASLAEGEALGVLVRGAVSGPGRALLEGAEAAATALAPLLPAPVAEVILQPDLTAVAPGPLVRELADALALAADVESTGGATVYRFTPSSVRRALDAGRTAAELHDLLATHSRTPVPQPLSYLVDDVARRHGRLRAGTAAAYLRCDDPALLGEVLADRRTADLGLRRLAPTVLAAAAPAPELLDRLRALGYAPAAEAADGALLLGRPPGRRAEERFDRLRPAPPRLPGPSLARAAVRAVRAGDHPPGGAAAEERPGVGGADGLPTALRRLLAAGRDGVSVWLGYVDAGGRSSRRLVDPLAVANGQLTAYDHLHEEVRVFALHRVTDVAFPDTDHPPPGHDQPATARGTA